MLDLCLGVFLARPWAVSSSAPKRRPQTSLFLPFSTRKTPVARSLIQITMNRCHFLNHQLFNVVTHGITHVTNHHGIIMLFGITLIRFKARSFGPRRPSALADRNRRPPTRSWASWVGSSPRAARCASEAAACGVGLGGTGSAPRSKEVNRALIITSGLAWKRWSRSPKNC